MFLHAPLCVCVCVQVAVPRELTALMSAKRQGSVPHLSDSSKTVFKFHQMIPISSYLVALVVGALESRYIVYWVVHMTIHHYSRVLTVLLFPTRGFCLCVCV